MQIDEHTPHFHIRSVTVADKDLYMPLRAETSDVTAAYGITQEYMDTRWRSVLNSEDEICMVVFREDDFVAICSFQDFSGDHIELGYDVVAELRGRGIGTALAADLTGLAHEYFPGKDVIIFAREENVASWKIAERCGGVLIRREPTPEAAMTRRMLDEYGSGTAFTKEELAGMRKLVEDGKEAVRVYCMP